MPHMFDCNTRVRPRWLRTRLAEVWLRLVREAGIIWQQLQPTAPHTQGSLQQISECMTLSFCLTCHSAGMHIKRPDTR